MYLFQEFMILPTGAPTFSEALRYGAEVYHNLKVFCYHSDFQSIYFGFVIPELQSKCILQVCNILV